MDVARFLSQLYLELDNIEREIKFLDPPETGGETRYQVGHGLSVPELEQFRRNTANRKPCSDRTFPSQ